MRTERDEEIFFSGYTEPGKGSGDLSFFLKDMSDEMWEMKKNLVKQKSEQANSKLLAPIVMIFLGILVMIMAPILGGL